MSVFDTFRIAASGLTAQRLRMDVAASNLANADTTRTAAGGPYVPESVYFMPESVGTEGGPQGVGAVAILDQKRQPIRTYDPGNPDADANGFILRPDVDIAGEMTDMMGAARSYQVNATVAQAAKQSALDALELGRA